MIHLNGEFMPIEQAKISVLDRGFIFGDGVYEVIPVYSRRPLRLEEHLARLQASLDAIRLANPHPLSRWTELVAKIVAGNPWDDQNIYLQVTRGAAKRDHAFPKGLKPTVFILVRDGQLTEASASNVFIVRNGTVLAPPKSQLILPGITYDVVIEILRAHSIPHEVRPVAESELRSADEIWVTSSSRELLAIATLRISTRRRSECAPDARGSTFRSPATCARSRASSSTSFTANCAIIRW